MRFRYSRLDCSLARLLACLSFFSLVVFYHHSSTAVAAAGRERERWTTTTTPPIRHRIIRAFRVWCSVVHRDIIISKRPMLTGHSTDNDYFSDHVRSVHRVSFFPSWFLTPRRDDTPTPFVLTLCWTRNLQTNDSFLLANLALPEAPRIEHRDTSYSRRPAHEAEFNQFREPDSKPTFSFMLRPRLIQEGIGCKLICCVDGKPQPKVTPRYLVIFFAPTETSASLGTMVQRAYTTEW